MTVTVKSPSRGGRAGERQSAFAALGPFGLLWPMSAAMCLVGCSSEPKAVTPAATKTVQKETATPAPAAEAPADYSYSPVGKRDPFYSYLAQVEATMEVAAQRKLEPTESFELDQYRLTGLVTGTAQPRAMVEDPENKGHVIKIGSRLGKRGGVVTRINSDGIVVTEEFHTPTGDKVRVPITIKLPQPELQLSGEQ